MRAGTILAAAAALAIPTEVYACGTCLFAAFDRVLPPAAWWFVWSLVWLIASAAVLTFSKAKLQPQPRLSLAIAFVIAAIFASSLAGPALGFALTVLPFAAFVGAWRGEPTPAKQRLRRLGLAALLFAAVLGARGYLVQTTRSDGDFVVQWENTAPANQVFAYLAADPVKHEAELRKIALLGNGRLAEKAKSILESR